MEFEYKYPLRVPADDAWARLQEPEAIAACMQELKDLRHIENGHYTANVVTAVGPIRLKFHARAEILYGEDRTISAKVAMGDGRAGTVDGHFRIRLALRAAAESDLLLDANVAVGGRLGEFAQPLLRRKADQVVKDFAAALRAVVEQAKGGEEA